MTNRRIALLLGTGLPMFSTACGDCAGVGVSRLPETERTIAVGQSFTAIYEEGGTCKEPYRPTATHWRTLDTAIVRVDSLSGLVTGKQVGDAHVLPMFGVTSSRDYILVHVR